MLHHLSGKIESDTVLHSHITAHNPETTSSWHIHFSEQALPLSMSYNGHQVEVVSQLSERGQAILLPDSAPVARLYRQTPDGRADRRDVRLFNLPIRLRELRDIGRTQARCMGQIATGPDRGNACPHSLQGIGARVLVLQMEANGRRAYSVSGVCTWDEAMDLSQQETRQVVCACGVHAQFFP